MSSVVISGDSSGQVSLTVPSAAGTNTATLPAATGTVMVSGNMPAFAAYRNGSTQSITASTQVKAQFNLASFDTANCYDATTNYRFTPTVAGYYQLNWFISLYTTTGASTMTVVTMSLRKNGTNVPYTSGQYQHGTAVAVDTWQTNNTALVYANGSTDYFEVYVYSNASNTSMDTGSSFSGVLVRGA